LANVVDIREPEMGKFGATCRQTYFNERDIEFLINVDNFAVELLATMGCSSRAPNDVRVL